MFKATVMSVREGFSMVRDEIYCRGWAEFMEKVEIGLCELQNENPDSVLVQFERDVYE